MLLMKKSPVSVALEPIELCPRSYRSGDYDHHVWNDRGSEKTRFFFHICKEQCRSPNPPFRPIERQQLNEDPLYQRLLIMNDERECQRFNTVANAERWGAVSAEKLAKMYEHGDAYNNIEQNDAKALEWYQKAEVRQQGRCAYRLGMAYEHAELGLEKNEETAFQYYQKAADGGHNHAQCVIGAVYDFGKWRKEKDGAKALEYYQKAADGGDAYAQMRLGDAYKDGMFGLEVDEVAAFEYYKKAADGGDNDAAQYEIGCAYEFGNLGLEKNEETAFQYYQKAADGGHKDAQDVIGIVYDQNVVYDFGKSFPSQNK